ncbi:uncharacterized protein TNCV_1124941 [Trichonephila clavipes]|uniref:CCHC-type domain-containing protein n=1 Tax=Trichonephila clavipes TaxID=2585209 RepID=A0A8X6VKF9_TRICX|nr:uncharacterized protein TNCV_1124941 [Trichonephila clavipes]
MQKSLEDMQKSQEETKNELKERMEKGQEETKNGQEDLKNSLEKKIDNVEETINSVEERIALKVEGRVGAVEKKVEEEIAIVEEKIERIQEHVEERIKEQVEERIKGAAENFSLISQRMEGLEKKLQADGNENESKTVHVPTFPEPVLASPVPVTVFTGSVKLSTYDGKTNWEVYKTQFSIISEANGWTEGIKACQLAASPRGAAAEILQTLTDTERLNLNSLYNALDLRFGQKYSKDYVCLQMKTRLQKTGESLQEYASEVERLANLAFSNHPATARETFSLQYFVEGLKDGEIQKAVRIAYVQNLKTALLYALKVDAANEASCRDSHSVRRARVTADAPCESPWRKEIEKLREEIQDLLAQRQNLRRRRIMCWGCGETGHLRSSCPRINEEDHNIKCWGRGRTGHVRSNCPRVNQEDPCRTSVTESKKVCSNRKGLADKNGDVRSKKPCLESSKNLSNSLRVEKKFGVIDPIVRQVTTPSTSALDPWSDESVQKDQLADTEIKRIIEFKESSDENKTLPHSILQRSVSGIFGTLSI